MTEDDMDFPEGTVIPGEAYSALVTSFIPALTTNYTQDRASEGGSITEICIHHMAGNMSIEALGALWQTEGRNGSSHYGVNGRNVGQFVKERDIAWTNGDWASNKRNVTIEVANDSGTPDASFETYFVYDPKKGLVEYNGTVAVEFIGGSLSEFFAVPSPSLGQLSIDHIKFYNS